MRAVNCNGFNAGRLLRGVSPRTMSFGRLPVERGSEERENILKFVTLFLVLARR